ncbi:MAG: AbrB/MazE/SpoVT family DNA-binding domain-containing protein [Clostridia bacterium]|nr:AbrB/MazE/SpoVT family DNA-binding domain-containing protein [Clostridia bacterium]
MPEGKYVFGIVTIGDKGQIVIPKRARDVFNLKPGSQLLVLGDEERGIALVEASELKNFASQVLKVITGDDDANDKA